MAELLSTNILWGLFYSSTIFVSWLYMFKVIILIYTNIAIMSSQFEFKDDNVKELPKNVTKEKKSSPSKIKTSKRVKAIPCTP